MSSRPAYDLSTISATIITTSNRTVAKQKEDKAAPQCVARLTDAGLGHVRTVVVAEERRALDMTLRQALILGDRLVLILGGSGFGVANEAPEVVRRVIDVEITGIAERIRAHGAEHTALSPLSREVVGVTARDSRGALVVASPGSAGGASDTLDVLIPLLDPIFSQLDERR